MIEAFELEGGRSVKSDLSTRINFRTLYEQRDVTQRQFSGSQPLTMSS